MIFLLGITVSLSNRIISNGNKNNGNSILQIPSRDKDIIATLKLMVLPAMAPIKRIKKIEQKTFSIPEIIHPNDVQDDNVKVKINTCNKIINDVFLS
jgi:hypothetical protein